MNILVITPNGPVAERIIRELLAPEFSVYVLAENSERLPEEFRSEVTILEPAIETGALRQAMLSEIDSILWCHPSVGAEEASITPQRLIQTLAGCATPRIVTISSFGNESWEALFQGATVQHIRCGVLMENFLWQHQAILGHGVMAGPVTPDELIPLVAATDVADAALRRLVNRNPQTQTPERLNSLCLSPLRLAEVLAEVLDRSIQFRQLSPAAFIQWIRRYGVNPHTAHAVTAAFTAPPGVRNVSQVVARMAFCSWAEQTFAPLIQSNSEQPEHCCCTR